MYGYADVYGNPHKFGLTKVTEFDRAEPDYSFNIFVVWYREENRNYYWASDSGCSCPSPFEDYAARKNDNDELDSGDVDNVLSQLSVGGFEDVVAAMSVSASESYSKLYAVTELSGALTELIEFEKGRD